MQKIQFSILARIEYVKRWKRYPEWDWMELQKASGTSQYRISPEYPLWGPITTRPSDCSYLKVNQSNDTNHLTVFRGFALDEYDFSLGYKTCHIGKHIIFIWYVKISNTFTLLSLSKQSLSKWSEQIYISFGLCFLLIFNSQAFLNSFFFSSFGSRWKLFSGYSVANDWCIYLHRNSAFYIKFNFY